MPSSTIWMSQSSAFSSKTGPTFSKPDSRFSKMGQRTPANSWPHRAGVNRRPWPRRMSKRTASPLVRTCSVAWTVASRASPVSTGNHSCNVALSIWSMGSSGALSRRPRRATGGSGAVWSPNTPVTRYLAHCSRKSIALRLMARATVLQAKVMRQLTTSTKMSATRWKWRRSTSSVPSKARETITSSWSAAARDKEAKMDFQPDLML
mmetsp:Transcript_78210/g.138083  ORF Transcript_78210/g.138083 Transcript_78210/m.138083 type:complete len:207 (+) Transcript_78210:1477-2097(+)